MEELESKDVDEVAEKIDALDDVINKKMKKLLDAGKKLDNSWLFERVSKIEPEGKAKKPKVLQRLQNSSSASRKADSSSSSSKLASSSSASSSKLASPSSVSRKGDANPSSKPLLPFLADYDDGQLLCDEQQYGDDKYSPPYTIDDAFTPVYAPPGSRLSGLNLSGRDVDAVDGRDDPENYGTRSPPKSSYELWQEHCKEELEYGNCNMMTWDKWQDREYERKHNRRVAKEAPCAIS